MIKYNFVDFKSSEIGKLYSFTNGTYMPLRASQKSNITLFNEKQNLPIVNLYNNPYEILKWSKLGVNP